MLEQTIGFLGCGNMSGAILQGALTVGVLRAQQVIVYDPSPAAHERFAPLGVRFASDEQSLCKDSDIIVLGVKPQMTESVLANTQAALLDKVLISIAAGLSAARLRELAGVDVRVLRAMPNTPAQVFAGATVLCSDNNLHKTEQDAAQELFSAIGMVEWLPEQLMDAVCALSGGGPAFTAMFIEALADGAVAQGLPRQAALRLAEQTVFGAAKLLLETGMHPAQLKDMVTSPAGTTIAGCAALERGGMRGAAMACIHAAAERSKELSAL